MQRAFSLVELSIVLVILGLLTGGILAGQSLIRGAELRAVPTEYQRYTSAVHTFKDKYMALPGDMPNATNFWGAAAACPGTSATPSTSAATCNGDGNGFIFISSTTGTGNEIFRAWQHLANAGLIEGSYSGVTNNATATNTSYALIGTNVPASRARNVGWTVYSWATPWTIANTNYFEGEYRNFFFIGAAPGNDVTFGPAFKPEEAWNIDSKLDDGKPATGAVVTNEGAGGTGSTACSDTAPSAVTSMASSNYALVNTGTNCMLIIKLGV